MSTLTQTLTHTHTFRLPKLPPYFAYYLMFWGFIPLSLVIALSLNELEKLRRFNEVLIPIQFAIIFIITALIIRLDLDIKIVTMVFNQFLVFCFLFASVIYILEKNYFASVLFISLSTWNFYLSYLEFRGVIERSRSSQTLPHPFFWWAYGVAIAFELTIGIVINLVN